MLALSVAYPAHSQTVRQTSRGPAVDTGVQGRWFLVIRTDDDQLPEAGPFPQFADCTRVLAEVLKDIGTEHGQALAKYLSR